MRHAFTLLTRGDTVIPIRLVAQLAACGCYLLSVVVFRRFYRDNIEAISNNAVEDENMMDEDDEVVQGLQATYLVFTSVYLSLRQCRCRDCTVTQR